MVGLTVGRVREICCEEADSGVEHADCVGFCGEGGKHWQHYQFLID